MKMSSNTRPTESNSSLIPPVGKKNLLRDQNLLFRTRSNHENSGHAADVESEPIKVLDREFVLLDHEGPPLTVTTRVQSALAAINPEVYSDTRTSDYVQSLVAQEVSRKNGKCSSKSLRKTMEHLFSDLFTAGSEEVKRRAKNCLLPVY